MRASAGRVITRGLLFLIAVFSVVSCPADAQFKADTNPVLKVGEKIPLLGGTDQFGQDRDFENLRGA
jgi:hypothetical protein